jgi:hypothetical protein
MKGTTGRKAGTSNLRKPNILRFFLWKKEKLLSIGKKNNYRPWFEQGHWAGNKNIGFATSQLDWRNKKI